MNTRPKIGLLTGGYFEFWRMYPGLEKVVEKEMRELSQDLEGNADIVWSGLADTKEKTEAAGRMFKKEDIDLNKELRENIEGYTYFKKVLNCRTKDLDDVIELDLSDKIEEETKKLKKVKKEEKKEVK